ncbi:hypothetical protein ACLB2K_037529 [Fragaria x ananassa]
MATMGEINFPSTTKSPWSEPPTPKTSLCRELRQPKLLAWYMDFKGCFWRRLGVRIEGCAPINHHKGSTQLPHLLLVIQRICIKLLYFCVRIWYNTQASVAEDKMMMKVLWISLVADLRGEEGC